jgi:hypothetical protein
MNHATHVAVLKPNSATHVATKSNIKVPATNKINHPMRNIDFHGIFSTKQKPHNINFI